MGTWRVPPDLLASARFTLSPKAEIGTALSALLSPQDAAERAFRTLHYAAFSAMLAQLPLRRAVLDRSFRPGRGEVPGWIADYLSAPLTGPNVTIDDEIGAVAAMTEDQLRADLEETALAPLPPELAGAALVEAAAGLLTWVWTRTLATDWPRRERILRADIVARTGQLASSGWAAVLRDLGRGRDWVGDGELRINRYDLPTRELPATALLFFIPVLSHGGWSGWSEPDAYALYYPVTGRAGRDRDGPPRRTGPAASGLTGPPCSACSTSRPGQLSWPRSAGCRSDRSGTTCAFCSTPAPSPAAGPAVPCSTGALPWATHWSPPTAATASTSPARYADTVSGEHDGAVAWPTDNGDRR